MAIDFDTLLAGPIYDTLGVAAVIDMGTPGTIGVTVIDKTDGVLLESQNNPMLLATSKPAAVVRMSELTANDLTRENIKGRPISFNGGDWIIKATQPKQRSDGSAELYLILQDA